ALRCVDAALVFDETTATALIERLRPDIYAKGGDYATKELAEADAARRLGAQVRLLPEVPGRSTSSLIEVIRQRFCP
ncbi:MAG: D-beta-D-heptose 1-phosphate adenosyltransferase, partial [Chloroflexota bacterium]